MSLTISVGVSFITVALHELQDNAILVLCLSVQMGHTRMVLIGVN